MIRLSGVTTLVGSFRLEEVTLDVPAGGYGLVIGPTGSGKTTLLEAIAGHVALEAGAVELDGRAWVLYGFDVGRAIDLAACRSLVTTREVAGPRRPEWPHLFGLDERPLLWELPPESITLGERTVEAQVRLILYDFGNVSVAASLPVEGADGALEGAVDAVEGAVDAVDAAGEAADEADAVVPSLPRVAPGLAGSFCSSELKSGPSLLSATDAGDAMSVGPGYCSRSMSDRRSS